jgi:hypothetical protein
MTLVARTNFTVSLCVLLIASLAGCKPASDRSAAPDPATPAPGPTWPAKRKTDRGNFTVTIQPAGGRITRNEHFSLEVLLEPEAGAATPSSVLVDADMPDHGHGMNTKPETIHEGGARYRANGMLFHMEGEWSIAVEVTIGAMKERALFPVSLE